MQKQITKSFSEKALDIDNTKGIVKIAINKLDVIDLDGDISAKGSFNRTIKNNLDKIKHLAYHNWEKIIGLPKELYVENDYLIAVSQLNLNKSVSKDVFADYVFFAENDRTLDHSIGAIPVQQEFSKELGANVVTEWKLLEYSTVMLGANPDTPTFEVKDLQAMLTANYSDEKKEFIENVLKLLVKYRDPKEIVNSLVKSTLPNAFTLEKERNQRIAEFINNLSI